MIVSDMGRRLKKGTLQQNMKGLFVLLAVSGLFPIFFKTLLIRSTMFE